MTRPTKLHRPNPLAPYQALLADTGQLIEDRIAAFAQAQTAPLPQGAGTEGPTGSSLFQAVLQQGLDSAAEALRAMAQVRPRPPVGRALADADVIDVPARELHRGPATHGEA